MLLDCLHIGKNKKKARQNLGEDDDEEDSCKNKRVFQKSHRSNTIKPSMNANDTLYPMTTPGVSPPCVSVHEEGAFDSKACKELQSKMERWNSNCSIEEICLDNSSTTPMLFFSDGLPHRIQSWSESLEKLLEDPVGIKNFFIHVKAEHSTENIRFWLSCENYKTAVKSGDTHASERAQQIFNEFLSRRATHQVNLAGATLKEVRKNMSRPNEVTFEKAQVEIYHLMRTDSYPRFLKSEHYLNLLTEFHKNNNSNIHDDEKKNEKCK